jgi:hypothetical protein
LRFEDERLFYGAKEPEPQSPTDFG